MTGDNFFPCDAENFSKVYHGKVSEEQEERTAKALKEYRERNNFPEELNKKQGGLIRMDLNKLSFAELKAKIVEADLNVLIASNVEHYNFIRQNQNVCIDANPCALKEKWLPSDLVASEWDKREKEFASFLENARKKLREDIQDEQIKLASLGLAEAKNAVFLEWIIRKIDAVFGGEGK